MCCWCFPTLTSFQNMNMTSIVLGFGFLSFEDEISVERVTQEHFINLNGKQVM